MLCTTWNLRPRARERAAALADHLAPLDAAAGLIVSPANQTYLSGFRALLYSRPILLLVTSGGTALVVPGLEEAHARAKAAVDRLLIYHERPGGDGGDWSDRLDELLGQLPAGSGIGVELSSCSAAIAEHLRRRGHGVRDLDPVLARMRVIKDDAELEVIRESARVAGAGVGASLRACRAGTTEIEIDAAGTAAVMTAVARLPGPATVEQLLMTPAGAERSALPHALSTTRALAPGDGLIHTRQVGLDGYRAELERTAFVGPPDAERRRMFETMREAQARALDAVRAGVRCRDVDRAARQVIDAAGLGAYAVHRTGHGIGLSPHEPPYLRHDEDAVLEERMVVTIEPGIYVPGVGGFRHSDTAVVRADGAEPITSHPSSLEALTL